MALSPFFRHEGWLEGACTRELPGRVARMHGHTVVYVHVAHTRGVGGSELVRVSVEIMVYDFRAREQDDRQ